MSRDSSSHCEEKGLRQDGHLIILWLSNQQILLQVHIYLQTPGEGNIPLKKPTRELSLFHTTLSLMNTTRMCLPLGLPVSLPVVLWASVTIAPLPAMPSSPFLFIPQHLHFLAFSTLKPSATRPLPSLHCSSKVHPEPLHCQFQGGSSTLITFFRVCTQMFAQPYTVNK